MQQQAPPPMQEPMQQQAPPPQQQAPPQMKPTFVAIAEFPGSDDWQASMLAGDEVVLEEDHGDGWSTVFVTRTGQTGGVPTAFIEKKLDASPAPPPVAPPEPALNLYKVLHTFEAQDPSWQVSVTAGLVVNVIEDLGDGWSNVQANGATGLVPTGYLGRP